MPKIVKIRIARAELSGGEFETNSSIYAKDSSTLSPPSHCHGKPLTIPDAAAGVLVEYRQRGAMHSKCLISSSWHGWVRAAASAAGPGAARTITGPPTPVRIMVMVLSLRDGPWGLSWRESPADRTGSGVATGTQWHTASGAAWSALCVKGCMVLPKYSPEGNPNDFVFSINVLWRKTSQKSWEAVGVV